MGLAKQALALLLLENAYRPISGKYLSIGKQTVNIAPDTMFQMLEDYGHSTAGLGGRLAAGEIDAATRHGGKTVADHDLLAAICDATYNCLDISDYEGADIIQDMNKPIPAELEGQFDFVYDGSCMDNLFDGPCFIRNVARMLKPGGRAVLLECAGQVAGAYLMYSPEWFFSYFAINDFADCKVYVTIAREQSGMGIFDTSLYQWRPYFTRDANYNHVESCKTINGLMHCMVIAEKGPDSTYDRTPMQSHYFGPGDVDWREKFQHFSATSRPLLSAGARRPDLPLPLDSDHFCYIGDGY